MPTRGRPPRGAAARVDRLIADLETAWALKVAGWRALDPELTEEDVRRIALRTALRNHPWRPGHAAR